MSTLINKANPWRLFMLLNPPPPLNPTAPPEKHDPYGLDYILKKLLLRAML